jgi:peptide/nickel transport system ATP-binding protein
MPPTPTAAEATEPTEPLLSVRDLSVIFELDEGTVRAVEGVSFNVRPGQVVGIVGESGCGKSVTMRAILQLIERPARITRGEILYRQNGARLPIIDLARLAPRGRLMRALRGAEIALIPQEPMAAFSPVHTVGQQIIEAIMLHAHRRHPDARRISRHDARAMTIELFRDVGISMPEQRPTSFVAIVRRLRQRAMIASASLQAASAIADEPTTAIDVTTQAQILALLRELQRKYDTAIIFITHDLGVIAQMAHYVVVMYLGSVMEEGPVDDIFHAPKHPYTKALLRSIPSLHGETRIALPVIAGALPHPLNRPPGCPFHPRCDEVIPERCTHAVPKLQPVGARQQVSCFVYHDLAEPA